MIPPAPARASLIASVALLVLGWLALSAPWLAGGRVVGWDSKDQFYPTLRFVTESIRSGESPFWNPYVFGGYPTVSDPQSMLFSPLALALMLVPREPSMGWFDTIEFLHILLGGIGILLLSARFGVSRIAGLYGALVYMFGGPAASRLQHVPMIYAYAYFPFALLALENMIESNRLRWAVVFGVVAGIMAAHQNQVAYLFCLVLLGYSLHYAIFRRSAWRISAGRLRVLLVAGVSGGLTVALPVYATLQFLPLSNRLRIPLAAAGENSLHPLSWMTLWAGDFFSHRTPSDYWGFGDLTTSYLYAGALPIVLLLRYGVANGLLFEARMRYFLGVGLAAWAYSMGSLTPLYDFVYVVVPGVSLYRRPSDASFVVLMVLSLATAFLIDRVLAGSTGRLRPVVTGCGLLVVLGLFLAAGVSALRQPDPGGLPGVILRAAGMLAISWAFLGAIARAGSGRTRRAIACAGLVFLAVDLGSGNLGQAFNAVDPGSFGALSTQGDPDALGSFLREGLAGEPEAEIPGNHRVEIVSAGSLWANAPMVLGIEATGGYNPLRYALYERVVGVGESPSAARPFKPLLPTYDSPMVDLLGVRYVVTGAPLAVAEPAGTWPVARDGEVRVFENPNPLPRVLAATAVYLEPDPEGTIDSGPMPELDYRSTVVLERWPGSPGGRAPEAGETVSLPGTGAVRTSVESYGNTRIEISVRAEREAILVLNDLYYPGWRVEVDGVEREMLRANYLFRGVHLTPGEHWVVFRFRPFALDRIGEVFDRYVEARGRDGSREEVNRPPEVVSLVPSRVSGPNPPVRFIFSDPDGAADLARATLLVNDFLSTENGCYLYYEGDAIQLSDDSGANWQGPVVLGTPATLENSRCRVAALRSDATRSDDRLTLTLDVTLLDDFAGVHLVWAYVEDRTGQSAIEQVGTWTHWTRPPGWRDRLRSFVGIPGE